MMENCHRMSQLNVVVALFSFLLALGPSCYPDKGEKRLHDFGFSKPVSQSARLGSYHLETFLFWLYWLSRLFHSFWAEPIIRWGQKKKQNSPPPPKNQNPASRTCLVSCDPSKTLRPPSATRATKLKPSPIAYMWYLQVLQGAPWNKP